MSLGARIGYWCIHQVRLFFIALQFFTRLPIPRWVGFEADWLQHAARFFPLIGMFVAAIGGAIYWCAAAVWPHPVAVLLSVIGGVLLTGALHEDGFADVCDGFGGATHAPRILEIMKDSRIGVYGAIGIGLLLALKCVTLCNLPAHLLLVVLLAAHPLSRLLSAALMWRLGYVGAEGKAKPLARRMSGGECLFVLTTGALPALMLGLAGVLSWQAIAAGLLLAILASGYLAMLFIRRIGGYTGDCLGAVQQVAEVGFYLGVLACHGT